MLKFNDARDWFLEKRFGTNVLNYKALKLAAQGVTSLEEVHRVTFDLE